MALTLASLSSENVSMIIPKTMLRPIVVITMKKVKSKKKRFLASCEIESLTPNSYDNNTSTCMSHE